MKRFFLSVLELLLSGVGTVLGGGATELILYYIEFGDSGDVWFAWPVSLIYCGLFPLIACAPALVMMTALSAIRSLRISRHLLLCIVTAPFLGSIADIILNRLHVTIFSYFLAGAVGIVIAGVVEITFSGLSRSTA